jgi:hypothetical protein
MGHNWISDRTEEEMNKLLTNTADEWGHHRQEPTYLNIR